MDQESTYPPPWLYAEKKTEKNPETYSIKYCTF